MAAKSDGILRWDKCRGRCGWDSPSDLPEDMAAEALNVVFDRASLVKKRNGSANGGTFSNIAGYNQLVPFVPGQAISGAYLLAVDRTATTRIVKIVSGSDTILSLANTVDSRPQDVSYAVVNGKAYLAFDSDENRLHVFHPGISSSVVRRSGLDTPAAGTVANGGGGTYPATVRWYRIQWRTLVAGLKQRASNLGAAVTFTPAGTGTVAIVTRPTAPSEGETHWVVYGTADPLGLSNYFELSSEIAIATTTYDDSELPSDYDDNEAAPLEGTFTPWPSVKFLAADGDRLIGVGVWETAAGDAMEPKPGRVYFSPELDTSDYDDDERVSNTTEFQGWVDVGRNVGAEDRGICGPVNGEMLVGQSVGITALRRTGDAESPYQRDKLTDSLGWVSHWSTFVGEDAMGRPCVYFLDPDTGPYRYGVNGFEWLGYDVQDVWATFNQNATTRTAHGVWYGKCAFFWIATGTSNDPDVMLVFDSREGQATATQGVRYGWAKWTGELATARCSAVFSYTLAGATASSTQAIYAGTATGTHSGLMKTGLTDLASVFTPSTSLTDVGVAFQGYATSRSFEPEPAHVNTELTAAYLHAKTQANTVIQQTIIRNYGDGPNRTSTVSLTAIGVQTRCLRKFEDAACQDAHGMQVTLGDASAVSSAWALDGWTGLYKKHEAW